MSIVLKMLIKNITSKKARTFLILFSIILSTAVFFSSIAISGSILKTVLGSVTQVVGVSDITISPTEKSDSKFLSQSALEKYKNDFDIVVGELDASGVYNVTLGESVPVIVKGVVPEELNKVNPFSIASSLENEEFKGKSIIVSSTVAEDHNLKLGDTITVVIKGQEQRFTLWGIASAKGPFSKAITVPNFAIPEETMASLLDAHGKKNILYIKLKDTSLKKSMVKTLQSDYKSYQVKETFNVEKLQSNLSDISSIFLLLSGIVFFMSAFIIYSSFKVIAAERIPVIGTLRSIGATKKTTNTILLGESILYGTIGGFLGCGFGIGLLYVLSLYMSDIANVTPGLQLNTTIQFSFAQLAVAFIISILLSFISSIFPIMKISKIPIKDVILRTAELVKKDKKIKILLPIICVVIAYLITIPKYNPDDNLFLGLAMLFALLAIVFFIPYATKLFVKLFEKIYVVIFGNIGILAAKNLRENKGVLNNMIMLAISISVLLAINTTGYNTVLSSLNSYKGAKFDLKITVSNAENSFVNKLYNKDGVEDVYVDYEFENIKIVDTDTAIGTVKGIDMLKFSDFWTISTEEDFGDMSKELDAGRNIMISSTLQRTLEVQKGDVLKLKTTSGEKEYKIIGFFKDFMNDSDYALVSERFMKADMKSSEASAYYVRSSIAPKELGKELKADFKKLSPKINTKAQLEQIEVDDNVNTISLMQSFCIMAIVIGFFGVINNLVLSFMQRKQSLAMFRSVGMSKKQIVSMTFIEAFTGAVIGGIMGVVGGIGMTYILSKLDDSKLVIQNEYLGLYVAIGILVMILASIIPVVKSAKLNLIEAVKQE